MVEAAKKRPDIMVQVGLEYRYMPPVAKLIEIVKGGELGPIRMVAIREHRFPFLVKVGGASIFTNKSGTHIVVWYFILFNRAYIGKELESIQCQHRRDLSGEVLSFL